MMSSESLTAQATQMITCSPLMIIIPNMIDLVKGGSQQKQSQSQSKGLQEEIDRLKNEMANAESVKKDNDVVMEKLSEENRSSVKIIQEKSELVTKAQDNAKRDVAMKLQENMRLVMLYNKETDEQKKIKLLYEDMKKRDADKAKQIEEQNGQIHNYEMLLETSVAGVQILEDQSNEYKQTIADNIQTIAELYNTIQSNETDGGSLQEDNEKLKRDFADLESIKKQGESELEQKQNDLQDQLTKYKELEESSGSLQTRFNEMNDLNEQLQEKIQSLEKDLSDSMNKNVDLEGQLTKSQAESSSKSDKMKEGKQKRTDLEKEVDKLKGQFNDIYSQKEGQTVTIEELTAEVDKLKKENEELQKDGEE